LDQQRQARRGEQVRHVNFFAVENLHLGGLHIGRAQKELHGGLLAHPLEVDSLREQVLERID
jgi:hypothetical protein